MNNYSAINLLDAGFFSTLAYAPVDMNAIAFGSSQGSKNGAADVNGQAAEALTAFQWADQTNAVLLQIKATTGQSLKFWDQLSAGGLPLNEFRIFVNPISKQVVFAFKGSSGNANNWLSDLTSTDQGFSQYSAIEAAAQAAYDSMKTNPAYSTYQFFADGHSLGAEWRRPLRCKIVSLGLDRMRCQ